MKHMKKAASMLLALAMLMTMTFASSAAGMGTIKINGAHDDNVYEIYKMLDLESYDTTTGAYSYKVATGWADFFSSGDGKDYFTVDAQNYATWKGADDAETVALFAQKALAYAESKGLTPLRSTKNPGDFVKNTDNIEFTGLDLGYYLVDSTMGALCGLTTTKPNAEINAKNGQPVLDKQVQEDSTNQWGGSNSAEIGQTVNFRTTINVHDGAENYVLHDKMSVGLTYGSVTMIEHVKTGESTTVTYENTGANLISSIASVVTPGTDCVDAITNPGGCTFEVVFTKAFCDDLETNDKVVVYYTAVVNENAVIGGAGDTNEAWLDFGENHETNHDKTQTYTYGFDLVKTDSQNKLINGAEFKIYDALTGGNEIPVVKVNETTYRRAKADETGVTIVVTDGNVRVNGFDNGTYYLEETKTPEGYNTLTAREKFIISDGNRDATINSGTVSVGSGVQVVNKSGTILPETGGMGTVLFIGCGSILVMAAGVLLVTKKRMNMIED